MIIFGPIKDVPQEFLIDKGISNVIRLNLSSYYMDMPYLKELTPSVLNIPEDVLDGSCVDPAFDSAYHQYILSNDTAFCQFMSIVVPEYMDSMNLIMVLTGQSDFRDIIAESLAKLIQQRYGNNCYFIKDFMDLECIQPQSFSIPGLFAMDQDVMRWQMLVGNPEDFRDE